MKRWGFGGMRATHGVSISHRAHGSTGNRQDPGKVFKNKKMAGHMGDRQRTQQNLEVVRVDDERGLIFVQGFGSRREEQLDDGQGFGEGFAPRRSAISRRPQGRRQFEETKPRLLPIRLRKRLPQLSSSTCRWPGGLSREGQGSTSMAPPARATSNSTMRCSALSRAPTFCTALSPGSSKIAAASPVRPVNVRTLRAPARSSATRRAAVRLVTAIAAPVFIGGGKAHGARRREFNVSLNKKIRALGLKMALSSKAQSNRLVVDTLDLKDAKTKALANSSPKPTGAQGAGDRWRSR
jgi:hypothetical protein